MLTATTYTVNSLVDSANDNDPATTTLREAVLGGNQNPGSTIKFDASIFGGVIHLTAGELLVGAPMTVEGPGADRMTIDASQASRVFNVNDANGAAIVDISGLTITGGKVVGDGGGIFTAEDLTLTNVVVAGNEAGNGGGVFVNSEGSLRIVESTIDSNVATSGGGVYAAVGTGRVLEVTRSTVSNNSASGAGGGLWVSAAGAATLANSTFSGNSAVVVGGGVWVSATTGTGNVTLRNDTITDNHAEAPGGYAAGLGINSGAVTMHNTILAGNSAASGVLRDFAGPLSAASSYNLVGVKPNTFNFTGAGNQTGIPANPKDPQLSPLGDFGGSTRTHVPLLGSLEIDAGSADTTQTGGATVDQRGQLRVVDDPQVTNAATPHGGIDIGAVEVGYGRVVSRADFDGDGREDSLIAIVNSASPQSGTLDVLLGGSSLAANWASLPTLGAPRTHVTGTSYIVGDFNGDGRDDVLIRTQENYHLAISDGTQFHVLNNLMPSYSGNWQAIYAGDFDSDGADELAAWNGSLSRWQVIHFDEKAPAASRIRVDDNWLAAFSSNPNGLYVADANHDGREDLVRQVGPNWEIALSQPVAGAVLDRFVVTTWSSAFNPVYDATTNTISFADKYQKVLDAFSWVYNNVELELYPGLMKGPTATKQTKAGNDWDQAALLEQMLTEAGVSAQIVYASVTANTVEVMKWLGVKTASAVDSVLKSLLDSGANLPGDGSIAIFKHAWVRATVPTPTGMASVDLDPSWKFKDRQAGISLAPNLDLADVNGTNPNPVTGLFDEFEYLTLDPNKDRRLPVEFFEDQVMGYLAANSNLRGRSLADVAYDGPIVTKLFTVVPTGLGTGLTYSALSGSYDNLNAIVTGPDAAKLTHRVKVRVRNSTSDILQTQVLSVPIVSLDSLQITFATSSALAATPDSIAPAPPPLPATQPLVYGRIVQKLAATGASVVLDYAASTESLKTDEYATIWLEHFAPTEFRGATALQTSNPDYVGPADVDRRVKFTERAGNIIAIGLDANQHSRESLAAVQKQLLQAMAEDLPADSGATELDASKTRFLEDVDDLASYTGNDYWFTYNRYAKIVNQLTGTIGGQAWVGSGIVKSSPQLLTDTGLSTGNHVFNFLPYQVAPFNFGVDLPNATAESIDAVSGATNAEAAQLMFYNASGLEHTIVEEVINSPSVSTMKGLQRAAQVDLGVVGTQTRTGPSPGIPDGIRVFESSRSGGVWTHRQTEVWKVANGAPTRQAAVVTVGAESVLTDANTGLLKQHNGHTDVGMSVWDFMSSLSSRYASVLGDMKVQILVPHARTELIDWDSGENFNTNLNRWRGAVYTTEVPGRSYGFTIAPEGGSGSNGGAGNNVTMAPPAALPVGNFTYANYVGDPVNPATGNMFREEADVAMPNIGVSLDFTRHYDLQNLDDWGMGVGWMYRYGDLLYQDSATPNDVVWLDSQGIRHTFKWQSSDYAVPSELVGQVRYVNGGGGESATTTITGWTEFRFKDSKGVEYHFQRVTVPAGEITNAGVAGRTAVGRLTKIVDLNGDGVVVEYAGAGRKISAVRDVHTTSTGGASRRLQFDYGTNSTAADFNRIVSVDRFDQSTASSGQWSYSYAAIATIAVAAGSNRRLTSSQAPALTVMGASGATSSSRPTTSYAYYDGWKGYLKTITEPDGAWHEYEYYGNGRLFRVTQADAGVSLTNPTDPAKLRVQTFSYNILRGEAQFTDERGNVETYLHQDNGLLTKQIHQDRSRVSYEWGVKSGGTLVPNTDYLMTKATDERGAVETFAYYNDATFKNRQLFESTAKQYPNSSPLVTRYDYSQPPNRQHIVNLASTTVVGGAPGGVGDLTTSLAYDNEGRLFTTTDAEGNQTTRTYFTAATPPAASPGDYAGTLKSVTRKIKIESTTAPGTLIDSTSTTDFHYDKAGNLLWTLTDSGLDTQYGYDATGAVIRTLDPTGVVTETATDALGRVIQTGLGDASPVIDPIEPFATSFKYDAVGRLRESTDPLGRVVRFVYDGRGKLIEKTNADGTKVKYEYDGVGNQTAVTDELGRKTLFFYDSRNRLIRTIHPDGNVERLRYDGTGNVTYVIDELGRTTFSEYDVAGRLTETTAGFVHDATGALTSYSLLAQTTNKYDAVGRLVESIDPEGNVTQFGYDKLGRVIQTRVLKDVNGNRASTIPTPGTALAALSTTEYDASGNVVREANYDVTTLGTIPSDPKTLIATTNLAANKVQLLTTVYDNHDRVKKVMRPKADGNLAGGSFTSIDYDPAGRVWKQHDELGRVTENQYDDAHFGRLAKIIQPDPDDGGTEYASPVTRFQYDAAGQQTAVEDARGFLTRYEYDARGRLATTIDALGGKTRTVFDTAGQAIAAIDALGRAAYSLYDNRGRTTLTRSADPDGAGADGKGGAYASENRFKYDPAGQVTAATDPLGNVTTYEYDTLGRRTSETSTISYVVDDGDPGAFGPFDGNDVIGPPAAGSGYGGDYRTITQTGGPVPYANGLWTFRDLPVGTYRVYATWTPNGNLPDWLTPQISLDGGGFPWPSSDGLPFSIHQQSLPNDVDRFDDGFRRGWETITSSYVIGGDPTALHQLRVVLTADNGAAVRADAVRIERDVTRSYGYDLNGNLTSETDELGRVSSYLYDELDREIQTLTPPDPDDFATSVSRQLIAKTKYDGYGNAIELVSGSFAIGSQGYDFDTTITRKYDQRNRLVAETQPDPDGASNVDGGEDLAAPQTTYVYDLVGNLIDEREEKVVGTTPTLLRRTHYDYDALDRIKKVTENADAPALEQRQTINHYDPAGNVVWTEHDPHLYSARTFDTLDKYDALGRLTSTTDRWAVQTANQTAGPTVEARTTSFTYDAVGNQLSSKDPLNRVRMTEYDRLDRVVKTLEPDPDGGDGLLPEQTAYAYDPAGRQVVRTKGAGESLRTWYDSRGLVVRTEQDRDLPTLTVETTTRQYDAVGNLVALVDPATNRTTYKYDALDRQISESIVLDPANPGTTTVSRTTKYDARGNIAQTTDRNGRSIRYAYDALDRKYRERWYPDATSATNQAGNFSTEIVVSRDQLGRTARRYEVDRNTSFATTDQALESFSYDGLDRVTSQKNYFPGEAASLHGGANVRQVETRTAYGDNGTSATETRSQHFDNSNTADATTTETYSPWGELRSLTDADANTGGGAVQFSTASASFAYDASGALTLSQRTTGGNNVWTEYQYDQAGRLSRLEHRRYGTTYASAQALMRFIYSYDAAARISGITTEWANNLPGLTTRPISETQAFAYDDAGQLTNASGGSAVGQYGYKANGNRDATYETGGNVDAYTTAANNRVTQDSTYRYVYDNEGNLKERRLLFNDSLDSAYEYDHRNRLVKIDTYSGDHHRLDATFRYDAAGNLVYKNSLAGFEEGLVVENYVIASSRRGLTLDAQGDVVRRYAFVPTGEAILDRVFDGIGTTSSQNDLRLSLADHQNSTRLVLDGDDTGGNALRVRQTVDYAPFGRVTKIRDGASQIVNTNENLEALDSVYGYQGALVETHTRLHLMGARWYNPDAGRFVSEDPISDGTNWYEFAGNDPVNFADPTGLSPAGNPVAALAAQYGGFSGNKVAKYTPPPTAAAAIKPFSYNTATGKIGGAPKSVNDFNSFGNAAYLTAGSKSSLLPRDVRTADQRTAELAELQSFRRQSADVATGRYEVSALGAAGRGLGTGGKAVVNGTAGTAVSFATLGFANYGGPLAVNQFDVDSGYDVAHGTVRFSGEIATGLVTGGLSKLGQAGTAARVVGKTALAYDTAGNVVTAGRGVADAYENGLGFGNAVQIVGGGFGLGGNLAAGKQALREIAGDAGRVRVGIDYDVLRSPQLNATGPLNAVKVSLAPKSVKTGEIAVYSSTSAAGTVKYVGITNNLERRAAEQLTRQGLSIQGVPGLGSLSRSDARAVEQVLIQTYGFAKQGGQLVNRINSIATSNPIYDAAVKRGSDILRTIAFPGFGK